MVRQLAWHAWCDLCRPEREEAVFVNLPISIGHLQPRTLDLCELHYKELFAPVIAALTDHGEKLEARVLKGNRQSARWKKVGPFQCQVPGCVTAPLKHRATLRQHVEGRLHGLNFEAYVEQYGEPVPLTPEEALEVVEIRCEIGDCQQSYSTATTRWPQMAMVSHMRGRHGLNWRPGQPFSEARRIG